jgi:hypothetical protein
MPRHSDIGVGTVSPLEQADEGAGGQRPRNTGERPARSEAADTDAPVRPQSQGHAQCVEFSDLPGGICQVRVIQQRSHIVFVGLCEQAAEP